MAFFKASYTQVVTLRDIQRITPIFPPALGSDTLYKRKSHRKAGAANRFIPSKGEIR